MDLTPNLVQLQSLIGTWTGAGHGDYPTIDGFDYQEDISFTFRGKPFLEYVQRTRGADGAPMHTETGYLRHGGDRHVEFVLAQPTGQVELGEGTVEFTGDGLRLELRAQCLSTSSAKDVRATRRVYHLRGDELETTFDMEAVGEPMTRHLTSRLQRAS